MGVIVVDVIGCFFIFNSQIKIYNDVVLVVYLSIVIWCYKVYYVVVFFILVYGYVFDSVV